MTLLGGLADMTDLNDVSARSDAAIAFLMAGDPVEARHYMAATGAGRLTTGSFDPAAQMVGPDRGGEAGSKPQDTAIVKFSTEGTVIGMDAMAPSSHEDQMTEGSQTA